MYKTFIKDHDLIKETYEVGDSFNLDEQINFLSNKLDLVIHSGLFGFIGGFGKGKSTLLYNVSKNRKGQEKWINFDAWKYPNKSDLWEGFVLDFARQIDEKVFNEAYKKINGEGVGAWKTLIQVLSLGMNIKFPGGGSILEKFTYFFKSSPARRIFEIQEILESILKKEDNNIIVVIEDIDRSGDVGIFFLETLKQFIKNLNIEKNIIAIVPIADENFYLNSNTYMKCLDVVEFLDLPKVDMYKFVTDTFSEEYLKNPVEKRQIVNFLNALFQIFPHTTIRLIKLMLRKADLNFKNQQRDKLDPDWRVSILFEVSKYFFTTDEPKKDTRWFDEFKRSSSVPNNNVFSAFLYAIMYNQEKIFDSNGRLSQPPRRFKLLSKKGEDGKQNFKSIPWNVNNPFDEEDKFFNCDFYLNY